MRLLVCSRRRYELVYSMLKAATGAAPALGRFQSSLASAALSMLSNQQTGGISGLAQQFAAQAHYFVLD